MTLTCNRIFQGYSTLGAGSSSLHTEYVQEEEAANDNNLELEDFSSQPWHHGMRENEL